MAHIHIDNDIMQNICREDLIAIIQDMIHCEVQKNDAEINSDFIEECVNAMLAIEQDSDNSFVPLVPLVRKQEFIEQITGRKHNFKKLSKLARVAIVAATLTASTVTANAAVEAVTGVNMLAEAGTKVQKTLASWGVIKTAGIDVVDGEDDDDDEVIVEATTEVSTTEPVTEPVTEETTTVPTTTSTTRPVYNHHIDVVDGDDDDDDVTETTTKTTTTTTTTTKPAVTQPSQPESTTNKPVPPTTAHAVTEPVTKEKDEVVFVGVEAQFDNFKTDYIYGEELSYDGLTLMEVFSDGSKKELPLERCNYTKSVDMTKTADYTLRIIYKASVVEINITVRPDEDTRGAEVCSNDMYDYYLTDNGAYVTAYHGDAQQIELDYIDGNVVFAIGSGVFSGKSVNSFVARNVKKIFPNAFKDCNQLESVNVSGAEYIADNAFENCTELKSVVYSDNLQYFGTAVFRNTAIEEIVIPENITVIPSALFEDCNQLKSVTFMGEVTEIESLAFSECTALESVSGNTHSIRKFGAFAFYNDTLVAFGEEPDVVEAAGDYAFAYCNKVNITHVGKELKTIGAGAFMYCYKLSDVEISGSIKTIEASAFRGAHIANLTLSDGVRNIGEYAFMSTMIKTLELPGSVRQIGSSAFYTTFLRQVYFPKKVEKISENAFYKGSRLTFYVYDKTEPYNYAVANSIKYELLIDEEDNSIYVVDGDDD